MKECQASGCRPSDITEKQAKQIGQLVKVRAGREPPAHGLDHRSFKKPAYVSLKMVRQAAARTANEARRRARAS